MSFAWHALPSSSRWDGFPKRTSDIAIQRKKRLDSFHNIFIPYHNFFPSICPFLLHNYQSSVQAFSCRGPLKNIEISTDDCRQIYEKSHIEKGKTFKILWKRDVPSFAFVTVFNIFFFHSHFPIIPWYHAQYVQQRLTHKLYFNNSEYHCQHRHWINV